MALFYEFVQGRTDPYSAYLVCGEESNGMCLGFYDLVVDVATKEVIPSPTLAWEAYTAKQDFDCLSFYSTNNPVLQVACAEVQPVKKGDTFVLCRLDPWEPHDYEEALQRLVSY